MARSILDPSNPSSDWNTWEEYLQSKPGEFTSNQIVTEIAWNRLKIDRTVARILKMFDWYSTSRLVVVISWFEQQLGADNPGERWRQALLDFAYHNVGFDLKQLIEVLHCDMQVTIHKGLVKVQDDILEAIANFIDNFYIIMTTLSAPRVCALLDHMHARYAGSHSFLAAVWQGTTFMRPESFLQNGPTQLLQFFFDRLPNHKTDIERGSTHPTQLEMEVDHFSQVLRTHLVDVISNQALMLDFRCGIKDVPSIDLTKDEAVLCYLPAKTNIADDPEDDLEVPTIAPGPLNHQQTVRDESFQSVAPPQTNSGAAPATSSASTLLATDRQEFSPQSIGRLKALMSKENSTQTLIKVGAEEAFTHFDAHISQDEASYDGHVSDTDKEYIKVVPDEVDDTQIKGLKPVEADTVTDKVPEATNKEDGGQTSKSTDKKPAQKHSNRALSGTQDGLVCYNRDILTDGHKDKYPKDHISVHCIQCTVFSAGWWVTKCTLVPRHTRNWSCPIRYILVHQNLLGTLSKSLCHTELPVSKSIASCPPH